MSGELEARALSRPWFYPFRLPSGATVVGVPARVIVPAKHRFDAALDHANLPDPVQDMIRALVAQNDKLKGRIEALEHKLQIVHEEAPSFLPYEGDELPPADGG